MNTTSQKHGKELSKRTVKRGVAKERATPMEMPVVLSRRPRSGRLGWHRAKLSGRVHGEKLGPLKRALAGVYVDELELDVQFAQRPASSAS